MTTANTKVEEANEAAHNVVDQAKTLAEQAVHRTDQGIAKAGAIAGQAAEALRGSAEKTEVASEAVAGGLERASEYMQDADTSTIGHDAMRFVRKHPLQTAAAVVGAFILARIIF